MNTLLHATIIICAPLGVYYLWCIARHLGDLADELGNANAAEIQASTTAPTTGGPNVSPMGLGGGGR